MQMASMETNDELKKTEQVQNYIINNNKLSNNFPISLVNMKKRRLITQGNIGEIFEVIDENTNLQYIAKTLYVHYKDYPKRSRIDITNHIDKIKQINFPAILKIYDFNSKGFDKETRPTFLFEHCPHESLEDVLRKKETFLDNTKKLIIIYGIASSLQFLHSHNILHHDIKPSSIMIDDNFYPKISNIGFSNHFYNLKSMAKIKEISPYTAPEYITCNEYTKQNEVYAFGMIVYEIITNKKIFENTSQYEMLTKIVENHIPYLDDSIPKAYRDLIKKCLLKDPKERYTFEEICKELSNNDGFLENLERNSEFEQYKNHIDNFMLENVPFEFIDNLDELIAENMEINHKKLKKKKGKRKK